MSRSPIVAMNEERNGRSQTVAPVQCRMTIRTKLRRRSRRHRPWTREIQKALDKALYGGGHPAAQKARNFLNGTWLGEPLHVVLTDMPVGAWTVAMVFDALEATVGGRKFARPQTRRSRSVLPPRRAPP